MERILAAVSAPNRARLMGWLEGRPASGGGYLLKRPLDVVMALLMLLAAAPLFPLIALAIKLEDGGPVFFRQVRWGLNGTRFRVCKFRSMRVQREQVVQPATVGDDRCTRIGRFLRSMALDELPQLVGVLRGDMSFVGPRPLAVGEARFRAHHSLEKGRSRHFAVRIDPHLADHTKAIHLRVQRAESIRENLRKHWHNAIREIYRRTATRGFLVKARTNSYIV